MSLVAQKFYNIKCDRCGKLLLEDEWNSQDYIGEEADWSGWITHKRKHYCPNCYETDDDDNIAIKPPLDEHL